MSEIGTRTAELAYVALKAAVRLAAPQRNGRGLPGDVQRALFELKAAAATRSTLDPEAVPLPLFEQIDAPEAARRLGISIRAVQARCAAGTLPAVRVGQRQWLIEWRAHEHQG